MRVGRGGLLPSANHGSTTNALPGTPGTAEAVPVTWIVRPRIPTSSMVRPRPNAAPDPASAGTGWLAPAVPAVPAVPVAGPASLEAGKEVPGVFATRAAYWSGCTTTTVSAVPWTDPAVTRTVAVCCTPGTAAIA